MKGNNGASIISSLHRPYHSPLWVARWVCEYLSMFCKSINTHEEYVKGFYFFFIYRLNALYKKCSIAQAEYISKETIQKVCSYFDSIEQSKRNDALDCIMQTKSRLDIEKNIYSTYKAATYAINLATEKLGFVENYKLTRAGELLQLYKSPTIRMSSKNRYVYLNQIIEKDFFFFVPLCILMQKTKCSHELTELIFTFVKYYHPVARFDYTSISSRNYVRVRTLWIKQLYLLTKAFRLSSWFKNILEAQYLSEYDQIRWELKDFTKKNIQLQKRENNLNLLLATYRKLATKTDGSGYVNLYDIMIEMSLSYATFSKLLMDFYNNNKRNMSIFFVNIVATRDTRKRFYINSKPVFKVKISK